MKSEKICYKMVITNQVCVGGTLNSLNRALLGGLLLAYMGRYETTAILFSDMESNWKL